MTTTDTDHGTADALASRIRKLDDRLDALAELVGSADAELGSSAIRREVDAVGSDLRTIDALVDLTTTDDPFDSARVAIAVRRERLSFITLALAPSAETVLAPKTVTVERPVPPSTNHTIQPEGQRASNAGRIMSIVGLVIVGFFIYQLTGSALVAARNQQVLLQEFKEIAPLQGQNPAAAPTGDQSTDGILTAGEAAGEAPAEVETEIIAAAEAPVSGEPIGILQIPSIGVEQVVVQGSSPADLQQGPGHLRGTAMPGEPGNAAIAGSRLANGAPFRHLQSLDEGDRIEVTTAVGRFRYDVRTVRRVSTGEPDPVRATGGGSTLTLVTSTPAFLAYDRLVVIADLKSTPVAPRFTPVAPDRSETGFDTAPGGLAPVVAWGMALGVAIAAARILYRRWPKPIAYVITTPILLALLVLVFESMSGLLPATF